MELYNKADRIEESLQRMRSTYVPHLGFNMLSQEVGIMDETNAVVIVSGDPLRVGEIVGVNLAACRLFGLQKSEMMG